MPSIYFRNSSPKTVIGKFAWVPEQKKSSQDVSCFDVRAGHRARDVSGAKERQTELRNGRLREN